MPLKHTAALLIIGNEVLSSRTKDVHIPYLTQKLANKGIDVCEVRIVQDDHNDIVSALRALKLRYYYVFTTGGIGITHDDITAEAVSKALNRPLIENQEIRTLMESRFSPEQVERYKRMMLTPEGACVIEDPIGFYIDNIYVLAGMPSITRAMYKAIEHTIQDQPKVLTFEIECPEKESIIAEDLRFIQSQNPEVSIGSYPYDHATKEQGTTLIARSRNSDALKQVSIDIQRMVLAHTR